MSRLKTTFFVTLSFAVGGVFALAVGKEKWTGVDEVVLEKFAEDAGRAPSNPVFNTDQGDLLLFFFFLFGSLAGFMAGYLFRELFPPKKGKKGKADV